MASAALVMLPRSIFKSGVSNRVLVGAPRGRARSACRPKSGERDARAARVVLLSSELSARAPIALMGLLKSGFMQPVEDTTPIEESETLISDKG